MSGDLRGPFGGQFFFHALLEVALGYREGEEAHRDAVGIIDSSARHRCGDWRLLAVARTKKAQPKPCGLAELLPPHGLNRRLISHSTVRRLSYRPGIAATLINWADFAD